MVVEFAKLRCVMGLCQPVEILLSVFICHSHGLYKLTALAAVVYLLYLDTNTSFLCYISILRKYWLLPLGNVEVLIFSSSLR